MKKNTVTTYNIIANLLSFMMTFGISFYVTPYVTRNVGMEAYGLIGLANNITSYIVIATAALNSMASRFIILHYHKHDGNRANSYFNSALFANLIFAVISLLIGAISIPSLEKVLNISSVLVHDAKITFALAFINFALSLVFSSFGVGYYATNKLYVGAFRTLQGECVRILLLVCIFNFVGIRIQYTVLATICSSCIVGIYGLLFTRRNMPALHISVRYYKFSAILEMMKGGIWNSISKLSAVLLNGLDLIITNLFIGGSILGSVSVAKTFSTIIISVIGSISDVFLPRFLKAYAKDKEELSREFYGSTKILGFFSCIAISMFVSYSMDFYKIWLPGEDYMLLWGLSTISLVSIAISGPVYSMFSIYTVVNKVKPQALSTLVMSILSTVTVFLMLKFTDLGVYAIVGTSAIYGAIKNLTYNMYCLKKYIGMNIKKCYVIMLKNCFALVLICCETFILKGMLFAMNNFVALFGNALIGTLVACIIYFAVATSTVDKKNLILWLRKKKEGK